MSEVADCTAANSKYDDSICMTYFYASQRYAVTRIVSNEFLEYTWLFIHIPDLISMRLFSSVSVWLLYVLKMQFSMVRFVGESDVPVCVGG